MTTQLLAAAILLVSIALTAGQFVNNFDREVDFSCPTGQSIDYMGSFHSNHHEDRRWTYACHITGANQGCAWSGYVNNWDDPVNYLCPGDKVLTGVKSIHHNHYEDRRFRFRCCGIAGKSTTGCYMTGWQNQFDQPLSFSVPHGQVIRGVFSYHQNHQEDRRWRFMVCRVQ